MLPAGTCACTVMIWMHLPESVIATAPTCFLLLPWVLCSGVQAQGRGVLPAQLHQPSVQQPSRACAQRLLELWDLHPPASGQPCTAHLCHWAGECPLGIRDCGTACPVPWVVWPVVRGLLCKQEQQCRRCQQVPGLHPCQGCHWCPTDHF
jgi:hypothetical protein